MRTILIGLLLATFLTAGCVTPAPRPVPLSQADIIDMVKSGMTDDQIINRIDATRSVFRLSADDVVRLRKENVSSRVVTYMLDTYTRYVATQQRRRDDYDYDNFDSEYESHHPYPWYGWSW